MSGDRRRRDSIGDVWGPRTPLRRGVAGARGRADHGEARPLGQSACVLCSNGCGLDIGVKGGQNRRRPRAGPTTASTAAGSGRRGCTAGRPTPAATGSRGPSSADGGKLREASLGRGDGPDRRPVAGDHRASTRRARSGSTTRGQLFLEEYYTLARDRQGRARHAAHGRQHPPLHRHGRRGAEETFGSDGQPARTPTSTSPTPSSSSATTWPRADRALGAHPRPPSAGRTRRRLVVIDPRRTATAAEADVHLAPRARHQRRRS